VVAEGSPALQQIEALLVGNWRSYGSWLSLQTRA